MQKVLAGLGIACFLTACAPAQKQYAVTPTPQQAASINGASYPPLENSRMFKTAVPPLYPEYALNRHMEGFVDFEFTIEPDGSVADAKVIREFPENAGFAANAKRVFGRFTFAPDIVNGVPVATPARYRMAFKLR